MNSENGYFGRFMAFSLEIDYWAVILSIIGLIIAYFLWRKTKKFAQPSLFFSVLETFATKKSKASFEKIPNYLFFISLLFFLLAFIDPHYFIPKKQHPTTLGVQKSLPTEGIAIYLLLDQSGSMAEEVSATINNNRMQIRKEDLLKQVTKEFIQGNPTAGLEGRPNDLIGLVVFARTPQVLSPLTLDHQNILKELAKIDVVKSRQEDGTAMGYAIFKTVNMIAATKHLAQELSKKGIPSYDIKSSIIILVTDGLQDPSLLDKDSRLRNIGLEEAAAYAKQNDVRLYLINIDPNTYSEDLMPQRNQMESITQMTGGRLYIVNDPGDISQIYANIDQIEKSTLPQEGKSKENQPHLYKRISFYPYLISLGMFLVLVAILLNTTVLRKVP